jgi:chromosome segregation ATPase
MRGLLRKITYTLGLTMIAWLVASAAQQPAGKPKAPRLTTDDVRVPAVQASVGSKEPAKPEDAAKAEAAEPKAGQPKATEVKLSPEETSWREGVVKARNKAKEMERAAEEAELRITALRNDLGASGQSARNRNDIAAEIGQAGQRLLELRAQARVAADDAEQLAEYGKQKGFTESEGPSPTVEEGKPNEEYYRAQYAKLGESLDSAQRRVQLFDNRIRDLNQQISTNSGGKDKNGRSTGGDSFFAAQLQKDRDEAQQKLDEARAALTQAQSSLDALKEDARRAGVPPGLFR